MNNSTETADLTQLISDARPEQQQAIRSLSPMTVVSAGAGTGKTHTLARRFAWLLATDPSCRVDEILTLTFTQKAAAEMRDRIRRTLLDWSSSACLPHLDDAISRIDEAYISTIHSFALRVVKESGLDLDVDPGAALVDPPLENEFWEDYRWNLESLRSEAILAGLRGDVLEEARTMYNSPAYLPFFNYFGAETLTKLARGVGEVFGSRNITPEQLWRGRGEMLRILRERLSPVLMRHWSDVWELWHETVLPAVADGIESCNKGVFHDALRVFFGRWSRAEKSDGAIKAFYFDLLDGLLKTIPPGGAMKGVIEEALGMKLTVWKGKNVQRVLELSRLSMAENPYAEIEARVRDMLLGSAVIGWENWDSLRRGRGVLSFTDLIRHAAFSLRGNTSYASRFRHIMIDEFQDTDELQDEMVRSLVESWRAIPREAEHHRTLFVVGDIKQSIYRFRHANPRLFAGYITRAARSRANLHVPLTCSYRMSGVLMECVNLVFRTIWERGVMGGGERFLPYEPLSPPVDAPWWEERNPADDSTKPLEIILCVPGGEEANEAGNKRGRGRVETCRRTLARQLARRLHVMHSQGEPIWEREGGNAGFRSLEWRDIAVLVPSRSPYAALEEAFNEADIPALFGNSREYYNRGEVRDLVNLVRILAHEDDEHALIGWMESPLSYLPPGEGLACVVRGREEKRPLSDIFSACHCEAAETLRRLRMRANVDGMANALLAATNDAGWLAAYANAQRQRVLANVRTCIDMVAAFERTFGRNPLACADYFGRAVRGGFQAAEPDIPDLDANCVRVMTVHASKGLEFPIVALFNLEERGGRYGGSGKARTSRSIGVASSTIPDIAASGAILGEPFSSEFSIYERFLDEIEEREEEQRRLYVAMTRAQDRLICCGVAEKEEGTGEGNGYRACGNGETQLDWLLDVNLRHANIFPIHVVNEEADGGELYTDISHDGGNEERVAVLEVSRSSAVSLAKLSASAYSLFSWCPLAYRMRYRQGRELKWEMPDGDGYGGADLGSLAHWVLTRWNLEGKTLERFLPYGFVSPAEMEERLRALPTYLRPVYAVDANRRILCEWLDGFARTEICGMLRRLKDNQALQQEVVFSVALGKTILSGSIDVFWEDEGGCHVRDWKITPAESAPEEMYEEQVRFYALASRLARPGVPVDMGLIYLRPPYFSSEAPYRQMDETDWAEVHEKVRNMSIVAATGPFLPRTDRCDRCPFRLFCDGSYPDKKLLLG